MKQLIIGTLLIIFISCNTDHQVEQVAKDKKPRPPIAAGMTPIPDTTWVRDCIAGYKSLYGSCTVAGIKTAHAEWITYNKAELLQWLKDVDSKTNCDNIRVFFGVYPKAGIIPRGQLDLTNLKPDRLTVFLWPYNKNGVAKYNPGVTAKPGDDADVPPYDLGEIHPPY